MPSFTAARRGHGHLATLRKPLTPGWQLCEDTIAAIGPTATGINLVATLCRAGIIAQKWRLYPDPLIAVPFAVIIWHLAAQPAPPPPASAARRVIVRAAAALTLLISAAALAVSLAFFGRAGWVSVISPIGYSLAPLMYARAADQRNRTPAAGADTASPPA